jgi:flagellar protein FlbT
MTVLKISLRAGERIFVNGAVLKPDRKVTLEFLNSVTFLLEQHVLKPEDTTTPLKQLYFMVQSAIIDPKVADAALEMARGSLKLLRTTFTSADVLAELAIVDDLLGRGRNFECLRVIRKTFPLEEAILTASPLADERKPSAANSMEGKLASCR